jgi:hypothetical protein
MILKRSVDEIPVALYLRPAVSLNFRHVKRAS